MTVSAVPPVLDREFKRVLTRVSVLSTDVERLTTLLEQSNAMVETQRVRATTAERQLADERKLNTELAAKLAALETRVLALGKNSTNSSVPPSADGTVAKNERKYPSRVKTGKKNGGQPGHKGVSSTRLEPTEMVVYEPEGLCVCGTPAPAGEVTGSRARQLIGIDITVTATDHTVVERTCGCGQTHTGKVPEGVFTNGSTNPVMFDTSIKVLAVGLAECGQIPVKAACNWLDGMLGVRVSEGTVRSWITDLAAGLDEWDAHVVELLRQAPVVGADETPIKVEGHKNAYAHVAVTDLLTRFHYGGRAKKDIIAGGILENHKGVLVCDGLSSYRSIGIRSFQACMAHLLRELRFANETFTPHDPDTSHPYPQIQHLHDLFTNTIHVTNETARDGTDPPGPDRWCEQITDLCTSLLTVLGPVPVAKPVTDLKALTRRINRYLADGSLLAFTADHTIPATNNTAEQAVRPLKVRQRRSGTRRSVPHTRAGLRIAGYLDTARKNNVTPEQALKNALNGTPYLPNN